MLCSPPPAKSDGYLKLFISVSNSAATQIIRRQFDCDAVSGQNLDVMHPHFTGDMRQNAMIILQDDPEGRVFQAFLDDTVDFYGLFL